MPILARVYHVPPSEQPTLKLWQLDAIRADYARLQEQDGD